MSKGINFVKKHAVLICLLSIGLILRLLVASADPFLHDWDERFHALVARNMMDRPFIPMLFKDPLGIYDLNAWCCNHIWLHKQPLFLWQMALSMKVFGVNEIALRLPSVFMGTLMILLLYRVALLLTQNKQIALLAAGLLCFNQFTIFKIAGIKGMDHNDVALQFYILCSFWAYATFLNDKKWKWVTLIGVFAGCAILIKWLLGLSVFLGWGFNLLMMLNKPSFKKELIFFIASLLICAVIFLPWQSYILANWPAMALHEYEYNRRHITEVLEGHSGSFWFYFNAFPTYFGGINFVFLIPGVIYFWRRKGNKPLLFSISVLCFFVICFFSIIVQTKIAGYLFFIMPLMIIFISAGFYHLMQKINNTRLKIFCTAVILISCLNLDLFYKYFIRINESRGRKIYNSEVYKTLMSRIPQGVKAVINLPNFEDVELMFYQNDLRARHGCPSKEEMKNLEMKKVKIAAFVEREKYILPAYVKNYPYLYLIKTELK